MILSLSLSLSLSLTHSLSLRMHYPEIASYQEIKSVTSFDIIVDLLIFDILNIHKNVQNYVFVLHHTYDVRQMIWHLHDVSFILPTIYSILYLFLLFRQIFWVSYLNSLSLFLPLTFSFRNHKICPICLLAKNQVPIPNNESISSNP